MLYYYSIKTGNNPRASSNSVNGRGGQCADGVTEAVNHPLSAEDGFDAVLRCLYLTLLQ